MSLQKSTTVRIRNHAIRLFFSTAGPVVPPLAGRAACALWFTAPPRMPVLPLPDGGAPFEVETRQDGRGHVVRGWVWAGPDASDPQPRTVLLVHGWGGRGAQLAAFVAPLVEVGYRVVLFDLPAHGDSDHGPAGPRRTNGVEFAQALDAVYCRFGPVEAVVAHSMGTIATYLAMRFGWLGADRLVLVAPMVEATSLVDEFQAALGFGTRVRRAFERAVADFVGVPLSEFDARFQARQVDPVETLVITDRDDRQAPYAGVVDLAERIGAPLVTTQGLGHRKILRDPAVVRRVVEFVGGPDRLSRTA